MRHEKLEIAVMAMEQYHGRDADPEQHIALLRRQKLPTVGTLDECYHVLGRWAIAQLQAAGEWQRDDLVDLLMVKNAQYGPVNLRWHGQLGIVVRISDKAARLQQLRTGPPTSTTHEAIIDTLRDLVGYCVLGSVMLSGGTT